MILFAALVSIIYYTLKLGISPMPTTRKARSAILSLLPSKVQGEVVELGSGWGGMALELARKYPSCQVTAYELSWVPFLFSQLRGRPSNLEWRRQDFLKADLSSVKLVVVYLYPGAMQKLASLLPPDAIIISNTFALPGRTPTAIVHLDDLYRTPIYLYL